MMYVDDAVLMASSEGDMIRILQSFAEVLYVNATV